MLRNTIYTYIIFLSVLGPCCLKSLKIIYFIVSKEEKNGVQFDLQKSYLMIQNMQRVSVTENVYYVYLYRFIDGDWQKERQSQTERKKMY